MLVSAEKIYLEHHTRQPSGIWKLTEYDHPTSFVKIASIDCELPLAEIYDRVDFPR